MHRSLTFAFGVAFVLSLAGPVAADDDEEDPQETGEALDDPAYADEEEPEPPATPLPENALLADLSLGVIGVAYERVVADVLSIQVALQFFAPWYERESIYGGGGELRAFFFPEGRAPDGFYISLGVRAAYVAHAADDVVRDGFATSVRLALGYSVLFDAFLLRLGLGGQYQWLDTSEASGQPTDDFSNVAPVVDIYLGGAF